MPLYFIFPGLQRPEQWSKEARRQYASIVFSTAVIHFPLGLAFVISGILLGYLIYYLDLALGIALLLSGMIAIVSTKLPCIISINVSALMSILSGLVSVALFLAMAIRTYKKEFVPANPLVWIYLIFSVSAACLEILQLFYEAKAVKQSNFRRGSSGAFSSIVPSSEQAGGKVVTERTEFNTIEHQKWMPMKRKTSDNAGAENSN